MNAMAALAENRRHRRLSLRTYVGVATPTGPLGLFPGKPQAWAEVKDASARGFRLRCEKALQKGQSLRLFVEVQPGAEPIPLRLRGRVVWVRSEPDGQAVTAGIELADKPRRDICLWEQAMFDELRAQS